MATNMMKQSMCFLWENSTINRNFCMVKNPLCGLQQERGSGKSRQGFSCNYAAVKSSRVITVQGLQQRQQNTLFNCTFVTCVCKLDAARFLTSWQQRALGPRAAEGRKAVPVAMISPGADSLERMGILRSWKFSSWLRRWARWREQPCDNWGSKAQPH